MFFPAIWSVFLGNFREDHIVMLIALSSSKLTYGNVVFWRMAAFVIEKAELWSFHIYRIHPFRFVIKTLSENCSVHVLHMWWLYLLQTSSWEQEGRAVLEGREKLGQGSHTTGAVSFVLITVFGNWTLGSWEQLWGLQPLPCPDDSAQCF